VSGRGKPFAHFVQRIDVDRRLSDGLKQELLRLEEGFPLELAQMRRELLERQAERGERVNLKG